MRRLQVNLTADTEYAVGAGEVVLGGYGALVIAVFRLEETGLQRQAVGSLVVAAETDAVTVDDMSFMYSSVRP